MKLCYIGWGHSIHTQRWLGWFSKRGHDVHLITDNPGNIDKVIEYDIRPRPDNRGRLARYRDLNFNIHWVQKRIKPIHTVRRLVRQIAPDVLHLHTLYYPAYLGTYTNHHPMVVTPWNGDIVVHDERFTRWRRMMVQRALRMADLITVDSRDLGKGCLQYKGVVKDKIRLIQWGVDLDHFNPNVDTTPLAKQLGLSDDTPVVLSTRHLSKQYNVDIIIRAIPLILKQIPMAKFIFLYLTASDEYEIKKLVEDLGVKKSVLFLGSVDCYNDLARYYAMADVYVSVSSWDTTSVSFLEAIACGTAPIVGDLPSLREWIIDGENGYVVPLRDPHATAGAIIKILTDEPTRKLFIRRNLKMVRERADHQKEMEKMEVLYYKLIKG